MEISFEPNEEKISVEWVYLNKGDDEQIVRKQLVQTWTQILEKYAEPGAYIPQIEALKRELLDTGVRAAAKKVKKEHWFVPSFVIEEQIRSKVELGLNQLESLLAGFVEDVRWAQTHPEVLPSLRKAIQDCVLQ